MLQVLHISSSNKAVVFREMDEYVDGIFIDTVACGFLQVLWRRVTHDPFTASTYQLIHVTQLSLEQSHTKPQTGSIVCSHCWVHCAHRRLASL